MYHPNIDDNGAICLPMLKEWSPACTIVKGAPPRAAPLRPVASISPAPAGGRGADRRAVPRMAGWLHRRRCRRVSLQTRQFLSHRPRLFVIAVMAQIKSLLLAPATDTPLKAEIATQYNADLAAYEAQVRATVAEYAQEA